MTASVPPDGEAILDLDASPSVSDYCETCDGTGWVVCWSPGGSCGRTVLCDLCGPCLSCERGNLLQGQLVGDILRAGPEWREEMRSDG